MNYMIKIRKKFRKLLSEHGFTETSSAKFERVYKDIRQGIAFDHHKGYKRISCHCWLNSFYSDSYFDYELEELFYENDEDFIKQLDLLYTEVESVLPDYDEVGNQYAMSVSLAHKYNNLRDQYIEKYIRLHGKFPDSMDELVENLKKDYEGKQELSKEEKDDWVCMGASVSLKYIMRNYPGWEILGIPSVPVWLRKGNDYYDPIKVSYFAFLTMDFEGFYTGRENYCFINGKIRKRKRIINQRFQ